MDAPFPRGQGTAGKSGQVKRDRNETEDELFKVKKTRKVEIEKTKQVKRKRENAENAKQSPVVGLGMVKVVGNKASVKIETIAFKSYTIGCHALGFVLQINEDALVVSLPGGLSASIPIAEVSDIHHRYFHGGDIQDPPAPLIDVVKPMQPIRCVIIGFHESLNSKKKGLIGSMRPSQINRSLSMRHLAAGFPLAGTISSTEDRGYIVSCGVQGISFFLPFSAVPHDMKTLPAANSVTLRAQKKSVSEAVTRAVNLSFACLQPGMLVSVVLDKIAINGLVVSFLGVFHGTVDLSSLTRVNTGGDSWKKDLVEGDVLQARIVFVDHGSKSVRLSLRPHVVELRAPVAIPALGEILLDYQVSVVLKNVGILLTHADEDLEEAGGEDPLPNGEETKGEDGVEKKKGRNKKALAAAAQAKRMRDEMSVRGVFVHKSSLNTPSENGVYVPWEDRYKVGMHLDAIRVMGHHLVEGVAVGSNKESFVGGSVIHSSQVEVGQVIEAEIQKVADFGLVVLLGGKVRAICPLMHLFESSGSAPQMTKKFKPKQKLSLRVWEARDGSVVMTNKKSIVQAEDQYLLRSLEEAVEGKVALGVVSRISQSGLQVHFFNGVKGLVPMSVLVKQGVTDVDEAYRLGQVVRCVILRKIDASTRHANSKSKLLLGLDIGDTSSILARKDRSGSIDETEPRAPAEQAGEQTTPHIVTESQLLVSGTIIKGDGDDIAVRLDDGQLATLPRSQICDIALYSEACRSDNRFSVGMRITNAVIINGPSAQGKNPSPTILSLKPLLLSAAGALPALSNYFSSREQDAATIPMKVAELSPGQRVVGFVWKVEAYGVLVKFRDGMTALAPRPNVADRFITSPVGLFSVGDAVQCVVQRVDLASDRAIVTLKPVLVAPSSGCVTYLSSLLIESFRSLAIGPSAPPLNWRAFPIGTVITCTVHQIRDYGVIVMGPDHTTLMLARIFLPDQSLVEGSPVDALILDVDMTSGVLEVSIDREITQAVKKMQVGGEKKLKKKKRKDEDDADSSALFPPLSSLTPGEIYSSAVVLAVKPKYLIALLQETALAYVMVADYHCPYKDTAPYSVGQRVPIRLERVLRARVPAADIHSPYDSVSIGSLYEAMSDQHRKQSAITQKEVEEADAKLHDRFSAHTSPDGSNAITSSQPKLVRQNFIQSLRMGSVVKWEVQEISPVELSLQPENYREMNLNIKATLHVSCAIDQCDGCDDLEATLERAKSSQPNTREGVSPLHPFSKIRVGQIITARIIHIRHENDEGGEPERENESHSEKSKIVLLLASVPAATAKDNKWRALVQWKGRDSVKVGSLYASVVTHFDNARCTIAISPYVSCHLSFMDISSDINVVKSFQAFCFVGMKIVVAVTCCDPSGRYLSLQASRLAIEESLSGSVILDLSKHVKVDSLPNTSPLATWKPGELVIGMVDTQSGFKVPRPPAFSLVLAHNRMGRVCVTEVADIGHWVADYSTLFAPENVSSSLNAGKRPRSDSNVSAASSVSASDGAAGGSRPHGPRHGDIVECRVLALPTSEHSSSCYELSLRPSRTDPNLKKKKAIKADPLPTAGSVVSGYVAQISSKGCFVRLTSTITGRVLLKDLSDEFVHSPVTFFPPGKLVEARVLSVSETSGEAATATHVSLTLRSSAVFGEASQKELAKLHPGDIVTGKVHRITDFGVFVSLDNSTLVALCRKPMALNTPSAELKDHYEIGDHVRAKILGITGQKISLGLKPSCFEDTNESDDDSNAEEVDAEDGAGIQEDFHDDVLVDDDDSEEEREVQALIRKASLGHVQGDSDEEEDGEGEGEGGQEPEDDAEESDEQEGEESDDDNNGEEEEEVGQPIKRTKVDIVTSALPTQVSAKDKTVQNKDKPSHSNVVTSTSASLSSFSSSRQPVLLDWGDSFRPPSTIGNKASDSEGEENASEVETDEIVKGKRRRPAQSLREEEAIRKKEEALASGSDDPSSVEDFERILITEPNSSLRWVQYMSFFLLAADIDAARAVALRAIRTISFREEEEKYNVWVAMLNLEYKYGSTQTLQAVFKRAIAENKSDSLHLQLADLYSRAGDVDGARAVYEAALKKHKANKQVWMAYQRFEQRGGRDKEARALLPRSLLSLEKREHIEVILQYASAEFELGRFDRGREMFEDLLVSYPKRTDIWHVFVDKEVKNGNNSAARQIFSRMVTLNVSAKNIKAIFKKFLNFEIAHGTTADQEAVKQKARDYVNSLA